MLGVPCVERSRSKMKFEEAQKVKALIVNAIHITDEKLIYLGGKLGAKSGAIVHGMIEQRFHGVFEEINGMVDYAKEDNRCETCGRPCDYIPYERE